MVNLVSECCVKLFQKNVSCMGISIPQHHDTKISRSSASFIINRTQLTFINHLFLRLQISYLCMKNKILGITSSLQNITSFNIMVKEL